MALQTVFMAGLTLVYCLWISPEDIFDSTTSNGIHDCSIVLFVIADRVPAAKRYRNAFELIRQRVIDRISTTPPAQRRPRETVPGRTADLAASASYPFEVATGQSGAGHFDVDEGSLEQVSHILTDMAGEQGSRENKGNQGEIFTTGFRGGDDHHRMQQYPHSHNSFLEIPGMEMNHQGGNHGSSIANGLWFQGSNFAPPF